MIIGVVFSNRGEQMTTMAQVKLLYTILPTTPWNLSQTQIFCSNWWGAVRRRIFRNNGKLDIREISRMASPFWWDEFRCQFYANWSYANMPILSWKDTHVLLPTIRISIRPWEFLNSERFKSFNLYRCSLFSLYITHHQ